MRSKFLDKRLPIYFAFFVGIALSPLTGLAPATAQTEYDTNVVQAAEQEAQYKAQVEQERSQTEPVKEAYEKQLEKLTLSGGIAKHGHDPKIKKQISSLQYWLQQENRREAVEEQSINNLDGWTRYWKSKQDCVLRTQAWNAEQIELDNRMAQRRAMEEESEASRQARFAADSAYWNNQGGGYYGGGGHYYHSGHLTTIHVHTGHSHSH